MDGKAKESRIKSLCVNVKDVPEAYPMPKVGLMTNARLMTRVVYGRDTNLLVATREGGYHSRPHKHDCEQLNYLISGRIWTFIGDDGFENVEGDFYRMPAGIVHWGWVRSSEPVTIIEVHTPPLIGRPGALDTSVGLFMPGEDRSPLKMVASIFVDEVEANAEEIEMRVCGETGYKHAGR